MKKNEKIDSSGFASSDLKVIANEKCSEEVKKECEMEDPKNAEQKIQANIKKGKSN